MARAGWGQDGEKLRHSSGKRAWKEHSRAWGHSGELISVKFIVSREKQTNDQMIGSLYAKDARLYPQRRGQLLVRFKKQLGRYFEICFSNSREDGLETRQWSIMWLFQ